MTDEIDEKFMKMMGEIIGTNLKQAMENNEKRYLESKLLADQRYTDVVKTLAKLEEKLDSIQLAVER